MLGRELVTRDRLDALVMTDDHTTAVAASIASNELVDIGREVVFTRASIASVVRSELTEFDCQTLSLRVVSTVQPFFRRSISFKPVRDVGGTVRYTLQTVRLSPSCVDSTLTSNSCCHPFAATGASLDALPTVPAASACTGARSAPHGCIGTAWYPPFRTVVPRPSTPSVPIFWSRCGTHWKLPLSYVIRVRNFRRSPWSCSFATSERAGAGPPMSSDGCRSAVTSCRTWSSEAGSTLCAHAARASFRISHLV